MRSLSTAVYTLFLLIPGTLRADSIPNLTVLLSVEGKADAAAIREMKSELSEIMREAGRNLDIRFRSEARPHENFEDVVLVKLKGNCKVERLVSLIDERGPLAFTHSTDGAILPFAQVECDRLANSVARAIYGTREQKQSDKLLGRALGRVLAHELYHILGKTHEHNHDGSLAKEAISAKQLISDKRITFDVRDLNRMTP